MRDRTSALSHNRVQEKRGGLSAGAAEEVGAIPYEDDIGYSSYGGAGLNVRQRRARAFQRSKWLSFIVHRVIHSRE